MKATKSRTANSVKPGKSVWKSIGNKVRSILAIHKPDLMDLFVAELKDLYWAEKHLARHLPGMAKKAATAELKEAIENHVVETKLHVQRLEEVFKLIGEAPMAKKCDAMNGLVTEAEKKVSETKGPSVLRDVAIICACQKVEHYEIASYGTLRTLADVLGQPDVASILNLTLKEEKNADSLLSELAEGFVNEEAFEEAAKTE